MATATRGRARRATPVQAQRPRARSLGTTAMVQAGKFDDSDSSDELGMNVAMPLGHGQHQHRYLPDPDPRPVFPPPPTAAVRSSRKKTRPRPKPEPVNSLPPVPPVPPVPPLAATASTIPTTPKQPGSTVVAPWDAGSGSSANVLGSSTSNASKTRRKTLLERIEGWWDLGLLDKRQTLFRSQSKTMAEHRL